jgi:hypothetical protein
MRKELGLKYLWAKKTEKLSDRHIDLRYKFARDIQTFPCFDLPWIISG